MTDTTTRGGNLVDDQPRFRVEQFTDTNDAFGALRSIDVRSLKDMPHLKAVNAANLFYEVNDPLYVESSFLIRDRLSEKAVGYCIAHIERARARREESIFHIDMIASVPGSMAGAAIMGEILDRMNQLQLPTEFVALAETTGKILRRKTAREALARSGWGLVVKQGAGQVRHEKLPYRSETIRLQRQPIED